MALSTYTSANLEIIVPLAIEYSRETAVLGSGYDNYADRQYRYSRRATKTYRYKGMTASAVQSCLIAKRHQYMRRFMDWYLQGSSWRPDGLPIRGSYLSNQMMKNMGGALLNYLRPDYFEQVATFNVIRTSSAPVFDLEIQVDETVNIFHRTEWNPLTVEGRAAIESQFRVKDVGARPLYSYIDEYSYDET